MAKLKDVKKSVTTRAKAGQKAVTAAVKSASKAASTARASGVNGNGVTPASASYSATHSAN